MKYRKKPVVVEAFQFGVDEEPEWFAQHKDDVCLLIARIGDMIVLGNAGYICVSKKEDFDTTYEPVDK